MADCIQPEPKGKAEKRDKSAPMAKSKLWIAFGDGLFGT
jgi:hypothetical protein